MKFVFSSGFQHIPQMFGGIMANTHEMALELTQQGHPTSVLSGLFKEGLVGLRTRVMGKLSSTPAYHDRFLGYPVYRRWRPKEAIADVVKHIRPDVAVVQKSQQISMAREFLSLGVPTILYFHDVLFDELDGDPRELKGAVLVTNSEFTARRCREDYGLESLVLPPIFRRALYEVEPRRRNITMINPQQPKGGDIAMALAKACPDIPVCLVESWQLPQEQEAVIQASMKASSNLTLKRRTSDMKQVYRDAKIVLAPSRLDEAWGRIASEAQMSGIPVVASNRGGLPEAVGPGGVLLDPDGPIEAWVAAVRRLWSDEAHYEQMSAAATAHSRRPQLDPRTQVDMMVEAGERAIAALRA